MNKEIRQILRNQLEIMNSLLNEESCLRISISLTKEILNQPESKELPTEMPEEDEE